MIRKFGIFLLLAFVGIQFVPVERDNPPVTAQANLPDSVYTIVKKACFDCHSNETNWPWYSYVAPVSFFVVDHVQHGRKDLNFSEMGDGPGGSMVAPAEEIAEAVTEGWMPLREYVQMHSEANLSQEEKDVIKGWAEALVPGLKDALESTESSESEESTETENVEGANTTSSDE